MTVLVVVGTRPEAIKMAPVIRGLRDAHVETLVVTTGQHPALAEQGLAAFGLTADRSLPAVAALGLPELLAVLVSRVSAVLDEVRPRLVLVHGDTTSALAGALAAHQSRIPLGHVEAGLRTGDRSSPFPEEDNRRVIDQLATFWFAPTPRARQTLLREGHDPTRILVTGNPIVDAVRGLRDEVELRRCATFPELAALGLDEPGHVVVVTAHRRENLGSALHRIGAAVARLPARVVWPVHPNPAVRDTVHGLLGAAAHVSLVPPLSYPAMIRLVLRAGLVLTDSGGMQEEAVLLGRPTLVLRDNTERPEVLESGVVRLVGTHTDEIVRQATDWLRRSPTLVSEDELLGDGKAGQRIARWIAGAFA